MISFAGAVHIAIFALLVPWLAWRSRAGMNQMAPVDRPTHFRRVIVQMAVFLAVSLLVAFAEHLALPLASPGSAAAWLAAMGLAAVGVVAMRSRWRESVASGDAKVRYFMPRTSQERNLWAGVSLAAGVSEEVTYRGVLFALLWVITGSALVAGVLSALAFGFSHIPQGWETAAIVAGIGLALQGIVWIGGSLWPVIAAHFAYDLLAGLTYGTLGDELAYADAIAPEPAMQPVTTVRPPAVAAEASAPPSEEAP